ncbi:hypothetical protein [Caenimonas sp. SL110]|uniref:hypothetical protein n=1 Tax=Caenimonas sp. SL110 TaxID=1450524 RepID=UPI00069CE3C5|nr:hypothetical protein [Caenimonas sp. SL110]
MPVWNIESIEDRPDVTLSDWAAFEVPLNGPDQPWTRHLAGWSREDCQGQVCSAVQRFDPVTGSCLTESGRVYRLHGRPGMTADAQYVWSRWKRIASVTEQRNVTQETFEAIQAAKAPSAAPEPLP